MRGEAVTQGVRTDPGIQPRPPYIFLDDDPQHLPRQDASASADEHPGDIGHGPDQVEPLLAEIGTQSFDGRSAQGHHCCLLPFPVYFRKADSR